MHGTVHQQLVAMMPCRHDHQVLCPLLHPEVQHAACVRVTTGSLHSAWCQHCSLGWPASKQKVSMGMTF